MSRTEVGAGCGAGANATSGPSLRSYSPLRGRSPFHSVATRLSCCLLRGSAGRKPCARSRSLGQVTSALIQGSAALIIRGSAGGFHGSWFRSMGMHDRAVVDRNAVVMCVARGHAGHWEAFCPDFDLGVQGISLIEVREKLQHAINDYVAAASAESEPARSQLLNRRAPLLVRARWGLRFLTGIIFGRNRDRDSTVGFPVTCHA